jgi:dynein heavy chain
MEPSVQPSHVSATVACVLDRLLGLQGMQSLESPLQDSKSLIRLWAHEAMRVFHDRLVDDADRGWFCALLAQMVPKHTGSAFDGVFTINASVPPSPAAAHKAPPESREEAAKQREQAEASAALRDVLFADFLQPGAAENAKYQEASDVGKLLKQVEDSLTVYNDQVCVPIIRVHIMLMGTLHRGFMLPSHRTLATSAW